jgi:hypothetical protein
MTRETKDTMMKWVMGLFSAVILLLLTMAFQAAALGNKTNADQDLKILRLQIGDSLTGTRLFRIEAKLDSALYTLRGRPVQLQRVP